MDDRHDARHECEAPDPDDVEAGRPADAKPTTASVGRIVEEGHDGRR
jgi:hypothetical protein